MVAGSVRFLTSADFPKVDPVFTNNISLFFTIISGDSLYLSCEI